MESRKKIVQNLESVQVLHNLFWQEYESAHIFNTVKFREANSYSPPVRIKLRNECRKLLIESENYLKI